MCEVPFGSFCVRAVATGGGSPLLVFVPSHRFLGPSRRQEWLGEMMETIYICALGDLGVLLRPSPSGGTEISRSICTTLGGPTGCNIIHFLHSTRYAECCNISC